MYRSRISGPSNATTGRKYGMALLAVSLAVAVHTALNWVVPKQLPFMPFALAVLVSCRWGGGSAGMAATALSAFVLRNWFLPQPYTILDEANLGIGVFMAAGLFVSWQAMLLERAARKVLPPRPPQAEQELPEFEYVGSAQ
jgi:K+-sensing histidine kinase KdpD